MGIVREGRCVGSGVAPPELCQVPLGWVLLRPVHFPTAMGLSQGLAGQWIWPNRPIDPEDLRKRLVAVLRFHLRVRVGRVLWNIRLLGLPDRNAGPPPPSLPRVLPRGLTPGQLSLLLKWRTYRIVSGRAGPLTRCRNIQA